MPVLRAAFSPAEVASYRTTHNNTLTMRCDVRRVVESETGGYVGTGDPLPHLTDLRCTFMRVAPGFRFDTPDRAQVVAEPVLEVDLDTDIQTGDLVGQIRDELDVMTVAGWLEVKAVMVGVFSLTATLREVAS